MNNETRNPGPEENEAGEQTERRQALLKMGRFAAYAAPFTVLALSKKAEAATGHGPGKGSNGPGKH